MATIRELKQNYRLGLAEGRLLHTIDRSVPVPFSTGNALFDSALTNKIAPTTTLNQAERLRRSWNLVRRATDSEIETLSTHRNEILNDYKMLLAVDAWRRGDHDGTALFLSALPWRWRIAFPIAVIKPSAHIFTGWRKDIDFRLIEKPNFTALYEYFHKLLEDVPGIVVLKYQATIKQAAALMRFKFVGERERAIHDLCFNKGKKFPTDIDSLDPIPTYLKAREAIKKGDVTEFLNVLERGKRVIPITSFMGLIGSHKIRLWESHYESERLREYAVRCSTAVESLLRLEEWGAWLTQEHADQLSKNVRESIIDRGLSIPFFKVLKGYIAAPANVKEMILEPLLIPLLKHFGATTASRLQNQPVTFVQPGSMLSMMSFLLYSVLSSATDTSLLLLFHESVERVEPLDLDEVALHLADSRQDFETWIRAMFGGLSTSYSYMYDYEELGKALASVDDEETICLDVPFVQSTEVLHSLLPKQTVYNFSAPFGAPGEVCVRTDYYRQFYFETPHYNFGFYSRHSDSAAQRFAEVVDCTNAFSSLSEAV